MLTGQPPIFDDQPRSDPWPKRNNESTFGFLNRISGAFWDQPRQLVQTWAGHLPDAQEYKDIRARLRSGDDYAFNSAFLELYLHESFVAAGYDVTVHPTVAGTSRHPDFRIRRSNVDMYVEAIAPGPSDAERRAAARVKELLNTVDTVNDPNFWLSMEDIVQGQVQPSGARLRTELRLWLATLDPDASSGLADAPRHRWRRDGWEVEVIAIAKGEARGRTGRGERSIGVYAHGKAGIYDRAPLLRTALNEKHRAYGTLDAPYVIAVGHYSFDSDYWHATAALYGDEVVRIGLTESGERVAVPGRGPSGFFGTPPLWANRQVSGVLLINQLTPELVLRADVTMWRNPAATHPLPDSTGIASDRIDWASDNLVRTPGETSAAELFGLPGGWPLGEPWPARADSTQA